MCVVLSSWMLACGDGAKSLLQGTVVHVGGNQPDDEQPITDDSSHSSAGSGTAAMSGSGAPRTTGMMIPPAGGYPPAPMTSESSPARDVVSSMSTTAQGRQVYTREVHNFFLNLCGNCHAAQAQGNFQAPSTAHLIDTDFCDVMTGNTKLAKNFDLVTRDTIIGSMEITDLTSKSLMPPADAPGGGKLFSSRSADDPVVALYNLLNAWYDAGAPNDYFFLPADPNVPQSQYKLAANIAAQTTNLGTAIPKQSEVGTQVDRMKQLDAFFASATVLPDRIDQTDLISFDSEVLAPTGVISFAPGYPLFSDNAHKMRHVRVPQGQAIVFHRDTQSFDIPANTRFYKTFLKRVDDPDGKPRYRKIETRVIVSRPDGPDAPDGSHTTNSLFGTYAWNEAETEAHLVTDPLRNGKPFLDRLLVYPTREVDEMEAHDQQMLLSSGDARTYAIPSSERCIQCHMGSPSRSFILGFAPVQIKRRAEGTGGTYESSGPDELTQLTRFISYGLITGIVSGDDVLPLERSQGARMPRNDYELKAQAYMLGNCGNCHNPRGYPTVQNPVLRPVLNFWPTSDPSDGSRGGGVFQFPLDRVSPRIKRGPASDQLDIPYITPSLVDFHGSYVGGDMGADPSTRAQLVTDDMGKQEFAYMAAPWRSLIYRNVDSPYLYFSDSALFPHMPMNAPGFDERVPRIMGDWMVSIPARLRKDLEAGDDELTTHKPPYEEVKASDSDYMTASQTAEDRIKLYHEGGAPPTPLALGGTPIRFVGYRYSDYSPRTTDIVDPRVTQTGVGNLSPPDTSSLPSKSADPDRPKGDDTYEAFVSSQDGVPDAPHWIVTDLTEFPGDWVPRRSDWSDVLFGGKIQDAPATASDTEKNAVKTQRTVVGLLNHLKLSDAFRKFALQQNPIALWDTSNKSCNFSSAPKVSDFAGDAKPRWFSKIPDLPPTSPVYTLSPGGVVFTEICINCHGPNFDSRGRMADALALFTGGRTRVANLHDGMFGPIDPASKDPTRQPGYFRNLVFGADALKTIPALANVAPSAVGDDLAAHYMAWMALGGTQSVLDTNVLNAVGSSYVFGQARKLGFSIAAGDANMLSIARALCGETIWSDVEGNLRSDATFNRASSDGSNNNLGWYDWSEHTPIETNGDLETWLKLCAFENPPPLRVVTASNLAQNPTLYQSGTYPATADVGKGAAVVKGLDASNPLPWCYKPASSQAETDYLAAARAKGPVPICPADWASNTANVLSPSELKVWILRGAINAGFAVFVYLDQRAKDAQAGKSAPPQFNECQLLGK